MWWKIILYILGGLTTILGLLALFYWSSRWQMKGWLRELDAHLGNKFNNLKQKENVTKKEK
jgi:hypothetical protein